jgi:hypothetical protein
MTASNHSRLQKLVDETDVSALLCSSLARSMQLLATATPSSTAAAAAVGDSFLIVLSALSSSAHKLLVHAKSNSGAAGSSCTDGMVASIHASGESAATLLLHSSLSCKQLRNTTGNAAYSQYYCLQLSSSAVALTSANAAAPAQKAHINITAAAMFQCVAFSCNARIFRPRASC